MTEEKKPPYLKMAFFHWLNIGVLSSGIILGTVFNEPAVIVSTLFIEASVLWVIPDLPPFRKWVESSHYKSLESIERAYYLEQLWGLIQYPKPSLQSRILSFFATQEEEDPDIRIKLRDSLDCQRYLEMRSISKRLKELMKVSGAKITISDIKRFEEVINGYLRLLIACRPLSQALSKIDEKKLKQELSAIDSKIEKSETTLKAVLFERKRLLESQIERLPRLLATLELFRTRSEALYYQINNIHGQVLSDPGTDFNSVLDDMIARNDTMSDPLGQLEADQMVRDFMSKTDDKIDTKNEIENIQMASNKQKTRNL